MSIRNKLILLIFIFVSIISMVIGSISYYNRLNSTINASLLQNMNEMSSHDVKNIENTLNSTWDNLDGIGTRLEIFYSRFDSIHSIEDIQDYLNMEIATTFFNKIYLIDSEGTLYSNTYDLDTNATEHQYVKDILAGKEKLVDWYDIENSGSKRESLLYGVSITPVKIKLGAQKEITFVGIIGITHIKDIADTMEIRSFDGKGVSMVIDYEGYFIVRHDNTGNMSKVDNYFEWFREGTFKGNMDADTAIENIIAGKDFSIEYKNADEESKIITFTHIPDTEWCLIIKIPMSVLRQQSNGFLSMTIFVLMILIIAFLVLLFITFRFWTKSHYARVESKVKGEFLSNMSHEIRTPLHGLIGLNHLMKQSVEDIEKMKVYLEKSDVTANYLLTLINDILDLSKLREGKVELEHKPLSLEETVDSVQIMFQDRMDQKKLIFDIRTSYLYPRILGDDVRLKQVLINIIGNAFKFTSKGRVTLIITQELQPNNKVMTKFVVQDTGCGMSEEFLPKLFDAFAQEHNEVSKANQGTGLGMPITYLLVKKMGGRILVDSEINQGTTFTIFIPAEIAKPAEENKKESEEVQEETQHYHILVAEDNELNAEIMEEILLQEGFSVVLAENGKIALELFEKSELYEFDAILMDGQMPVMNGYDATRAIRALGREDAKSIRIYACTANTLDDDKEKALNSGMNDIIAKPVDVKALLKLLRNKNNT